jgi:hypothetical protein
MVTNWSSGLPWTPGYSNFGGDQDCNHNVGSSNAPCRPDVHGHMKTHLSKSYSSGARRDTFFDASANKSIFSFPGLDKIGNAGGNTYFGPSFFNSDLAVTKSVSIKEKVALKFRADAFNAFNHISAGSPNNNVLDTSNSGNGQISSQGAGANPRYLELSLRVAF